MAGIGLALIVALATGVIPRSGAQASAQATQTSTHDAAAAANRGWASSACTDLLAWKNELQRDATGLDLGPGAPARIQDAIGATTRMLRQIDKLGLPPGALSAQARADIQRLRSELESRVSGLQRATAAVTSGNLAAVGTLLDDLRSDKALASRLPSELRQVLSTDLGLPLAETGACRELVGSPI